jgi:L-lactate dehydrogenase
MKLGIVGTGNVGCSCAMAAAIRGSAREIVLVNRTRKTAEAVATDIRYGTRSGAKSTLWMATMTRSRALALS